MKRQARKTSKSQSEDRGVISRFMASVTGGYSGQEAEGEPATDLLKAEHDEVRTLFKEFKDASDEGTTAKRVVDEVCRKLEVHAQLEEKVFYPACRRLRNLKARKIVAESLEEHTIVKKLIKELGGLSARDESFQAKATVLKEAVEHHADEEEKDLFPVAEDELGEERLHDLGAEMEALKARLLRAGGAASSMGRKQTTRSTRSRARRRTSSRARMSG